MKPVNLLVELTNIMRCRVGGDDAEEANGDVRGLDGRFLAAVSIKRAGVCL